LEWYEAVRRFRQEKEAINRREYSVTACAKRAGVDQSDWSRMELGLPRRKDGSGPEPTMKRLRTVAVGLNEDLEVIHKIAALPGPEDQLSALRLAIRLRTLMEKLPAEEQPHLEDTLIDIARVLVTKAA